MSQRSEIWAVPEKALPKKKYIYINYQVVIFYVFWIGRCTSVPIIEKVRFSWYVNFKISLHWKNRGLAQPLNNNPLQIYRWHNAVRKVTFSWYSPNPDSSISLINREAWSITSQNTYLVTWGFCAVARLWKLIPWSSLPPLFVLILLPVFVCNSSAMVLEIFTLPVTELLL